MTRILIIEDNASIARGIRTALEQDGYQVLVEYDGRSGLSRARAWDPALIVLDLMLPEMDGYRVLRTLRSERRDMPVLILSARSNEVEKVRGFRIGADDYVTKPFGLQELLARIEALLRRNLRGTGAPNAIERLQIGQLLIDNSERSVARDGTPIELRPKEFDLLWSLARRQGSVASRQDLLLEVWGYTSGVVSRTVDTHIVELRRKLEADPDEPRLILTVRKAGYRLATN